jgi:sirohydrochlorin cobaltochelatase
MSITLDDVLALETLEARLRTILPELYRDSYEEVVPVSMGSAGLKYGPDGRVAWNEMWASFCDLAMAGGPPHRGTLLQPGTREEIAAKSDVHDSVLDEIHRGISLVTKLHVIPISQIKARDPRWIAMHCHSAGMAAWLVRAIVMENVLAGHDGEMLYLPAGPDFRIAKEIKNVITVLAKTCHYWTSHMSGDQHDAIASLLANDSPDSELLDFPSADALERDPAGYRQVIDEIAKEITRRTGRACFPNRYPGWIGVDCPSIRTAVWLMRAMTVENVLARREETVLFLPANPRFAENGRTARLVQAFERIHRLHAVKKFE